jgi:hypothetical protein
VDPRTGIRRVWKAALIVAVGVAGGGAALAVASVPDSNGVIHACVQTGSSGTPVTTGNLRVIDPSAGQSCDTTANPAGGPGTEENLTWNQQGPRGATGRQGPAGKTITVAAGQTLTISGRVITVGGSPLTINPPPVRRRKPVGASALDLGQGAPLSFQILSFTFGPTSAGTHAGGGGGGAGAVHDIVITKSQDKASAKLAQLCANGKHIPKVTITLRKAGAEQPYLTFTFTNVFTSSIQWSHGDEAPTESITFNFTKINIRYTK